MPVYKLVLLVRKTFLSFISSSSAKRLILRGNKIDRVDIIMFSSLHLFVSLFFSFPFLVSSFSFASFSPSFLSSSSPSSSTLSSFSSSFSSSPSSSPSFSFSLYQVIPPRHLKPLSPSQTSSSIYKRNKIQLFSNNKSKDNNNNDNTKIRVGILGASGYTGAELMRLLLLHPHVEFTILTAGETSSGKKFSEVFPQFLPYLNDKTRNIPLLKKTNDVSEDEWNNTDCIFCCLPHATTQEIIASLPPHIKIVDLSADFRLSDINTYERWYGEKHKAPELQKEAVYGLTELNRDQITDPKTRLIANPGCYPTAAQLSLIPLLEDQLISKDDIIIDAKSGTTGAGRAAKQAFLYCEVTDGIHAYGVANHRHAPEIEQGLSLAVNNNNNNKSKNNGNKKEEDVIVNFTPHLMPMSRGILETIYVKLAKGVTAKDLKAKLAKKYENEYFIHVLDGSIAPQTRHVSLYIHIYIFLSTYLSISLFLYLSIYVSMYLCICLSIYLTISLYIYIYRSIYIDNIT